MNKLLDAACRHTAGIAAGVILAGGLAGGVLLTPGTAYASTAVNTTTAITGTTQTPTFLGTTLNVQVSVTPASNSNGWAGGTVNVSGAGGGCAITLAQQGATDVGVGNCNIYNLAPGTYTLTATYGATSSFNGSVSNTDTVTIGTAPVFNADSPPPTATNGQFYSYRFHAYGSPVIRYALGPGSPFWLHIDPSTGTVWGTVPNFGGSFSYSVVASNNVGSATAGPFYVHVRHFGANLGTYLSCTPRVYTGQRGTCTLYVTNKGFSRAPDVSAQITLPPQLRADYCGYYFFGFGCTISGNTAQEDLGTLNPGQTKALTVVFTARTGFTLWGWHPGHRFTVEVVGSAFSYGGFPFFGHGRSYSTAYVTIIPRGFWW